VPAREAAAWARRTALSRRILLGTLVGSGLAYAGLVGWGLASGRIAALARAPLDPDATLLYLALMALAAAPFTAGMVHSAFVARRLAADTEALRTARDAAQAAGQAKAEFLATMSHEIRTPLNAVVGFAEMLGSTPLDPAQADHVQSIRESGAHLLSVVGNVLDYSKAEAGRIELEERPFEVDALLEGCVRTVSPAATQKGLALSFRRRSGVPRTLRGDATRLRQVLLNLLSNAVKFTAAGSVGLTASCTREAGNAVRVRFEVRDTGAGIPADQAARLFEPYRQVGPARAGGTGLGLAISRHLCQRMGGDLAFRSRPGQGSTFTATVLLAAVARPTSTLAADAPARVPAPAPTPGALRGLRLLVVDGNAVDRATLCRSALEWGMLARGTGDGRRALAWVRSGAHFDLAILGPGRTVDAARLAAGLRALRPSLPLIVARGKGAGDAPEGVALIRKPLRRAELLDATLAAVGARVGGRACPRTLSILLAEDNPMNLKLSLKVLEALGHDAEVAGNGAQAVEMACRRRYHVVLMDVQMPVMDGLQATREVCRRVPTRDRPFIIGLTANALPGDREACLQAGMDAYLAKPMDPGALARLLEAAAGRAGVDRKARQRPRRTAVAVR
jgi:signal transduction histidine kinase/CheY-like chemotaxis protein